MIQSSFDAQMVRVRELLERMHKNNTKEDDPALLQVCIADLCDIAQTLPSSERSYAATLMEALLEEMDVLITNTRNVQANLAKKLDHVRPHRQAVAAFLKASKLD